MLKKYIHYRLRAAEAQFKVPCDYLHHMVDTSVSAFFTQKYKMEIYDESYLEQEL